MLVVDLAVKGRRHHHHVNVSGNGCPKSGERVVVPRRCPVDNSGRVVGVATYLAQSRKMLDGRSDASPVHSFGEGGYLRRNGLGRGTVTATELADWLIHPHHGRWHDVSNWRQIGVDTGCLELAAP